MKKTLFSLLFCLLASGVWAQNNCYWVFLSDKHGSTFDPYSYFDAKAVERYRQCGADLYDISNYPLAAPYVDAIEDLATEMVGQSRWLNAVAVTATQQEAEKIAMLPFVRYVQAITGDMQLAERSLQVTRQATDDDGDSSVWVANQLLRMQGDQFIVNGIDGMGVRIAVLDGGFPNVDSHPAFKHLRDNDRILDTWNFPNKKANVYGWDSHGTMTLSCITGRVGTTQIGLATGADFLLYRTEVDLEPFKEEVWWMMGMERADKYGADIISSSLGYGKDRHYTKDMDGTSYVAKAANMAARKGILVCNSAGNEADDSSWKTIITPSDADSVLCVGGIEADLYNYRHINFSSLGPSADGRLKPEVCAFGHAVVADPGTDTTTKAYGTSFSCPLVAGFAACAKQLLPNFTAMQLKKEIERSADRYPYFDYALGYGVPQASYFFDNGAERDDDTTVVIIDTLGAVFVIPLTSNRNGIIFFNKQRPDGTLENYFDCEVYALDNETLFYFDKDALDSCTLNVWYDGYTASYKNPDYQPSSSSSETFYPHVETSASARLEALHRYDASSLQTSQWGNCASWRYDIYFQFGSMFNSADNEATLGSFSPACHLGFRLMKGLGKAYALGVGVEWGMDRYNLLKNKDYAIDQFLATTLFNGVSPEVTKKYMRNGMVSLELFQRVRLVAGGSLEHRGIYWDLGIFANWNYYSYHVGLKGNSFASKSSHVFTNPSVRDLYRWNWGITTRIGYDIVSLYVRYRLTHITDNSDNTDNMVPADRYLNLPRLEIGVGIDF